LIILASPPDRHLSKALTQIIEIQDLQNNWSAVRGWLLDQAALELKIYSRSGFLRVTAGEYRLSTSVNLELNGDTVRTYFPQAIMDDAPKNINEFRTWWNKINDSQLTTFVALFKTPIENCKATDSMIYTLGPKPVLQEKPLECSPDNDAGAGIFTQVPGTISCYSKDVAYTQTSAPPTCQIWLQYVLKNDLVAGITHRVGANLVVPGEYVHLKESIFKKRYSDWGEGQFQTAFADLASVPEEFLAISLDSAKARIAEIQPKNEYIVEVLGLKIPAEELAKWGSWLLVAVQLYFWIHLHELNRKLDPSSPGFEVAWIGIYRSWIAAAAVLTSSCILPIGALWVLYSRARGVDGVAPAYAAWSIYAGVLLAILTGERTLRIRRQLKPRIVASVS
jgi:hypothetical protein